MEAVILAVVLQIGGGTAALLFVRSPRLATTVGCGAAIVGSLLLVVPAFDVLLSGTALLLNWSWDEAHGAFIVGLDPLSSFFLLPIALLSLLATVYGSHYLFSYRREKSLGPPWFLFNAFIAGMTLVVVARTTLLFFVAWEVMSLTAFGLVTFEQEKEEVRRAGWIYLVITHLGVLVLLAAFLLLAQLAGGTTFDGFQKAVVSGPWAGLIFVLAILGFGAKAGFVPLHVWLPEAHPAAPSHVSALMSGVMIKMGIYGLLRMLTFLGSPEPWWGWTLAGIGLLTSLVGISLALSQRDVKRALAYSSIENIGLIALGLGVGLWGWSTHHGLVAVLALTAALLHVWNHALMKGLMFFAAGSIYHATGTKDMEKLGGLLKRMPWTGGAMMIGAIAIAALPPLNGFVSKWLLYVSLMKGGLVAGQSVALCVLMSMGVLAIVGGLTAIAFVRLTGIALLGSPRSAAADHAHESSGWLVAPMMVLALLCLAAATFPQFLALGVSNVVNEILGPNAAPAGNESGSAFDLLSSLGAVNAWIIFAGLCLSSVLMRLMSRVGREREGEEVKTWGCGYTQPTPRMQYSGRSFVETIAEQLLPRFLRPKTTREAPQGLFPDSGHFAAKCLDPIDQELYEPLARRCAERFSRLRILQQGKVHIYLVYIMLTVVLALAWVSLRTWWGKS